MKGNTIKIKREEKMRRFFLILILFVTLGTSGFLMGYDYKQNSLFAGLGFASSDFEGVLIEGGIEFGLSKNIYVKALVDYYFDPLGKDEPEDISVKAYGLNVYFVYKLRLSKKLNLFGQSGINLTTIKETMGFMSVTSGNFGIGVGSGIEYMFKPRMGIHCGATYKYVFMAGENLRWYKFYLGFVFRLKAPSRW